MRPDTISNSNIWMIHWAHEYSAYASILTLTMSREEYYYGATRGQITLQSLLLHSEISQSSHNLPCEGQDMKQEDDSFKWIIHIFFLFFKNG